MKPAPFTYHDPRTVDDVTSLLGELEMPKLLAGGQSLMPMLNMRYVFADNIIDLNTVDGLDGITRNNGSVRIGAMTRQRTLQRDAIIAEDLPIMQDALHWVGHLATRSRGTFGGSLSHLDPAAELPGIVALYDGTLEVQSKRGKREVAAMDWNQGYMTPALEPDELLIGATLPVWPKPYGYAFQELSRRHGDFAIIGVGALLNVESSGNVAKAAIVVLGANIAPVRLTDAEQQLIGQPATEDTFRAAAELARKIDAMDDVHVSAGYRQQVAATLVRRTLVEAAGRAQGGN
jgi:carbon-monoxide dehydrogenase medium subunit